MGQHEIIQALDKLPEKEWLSTTELMKINKTNRSNTSSTLKRLRDFGEVESKQKKEAKGEYEHRLTQKGRL